MKKTAFFFLVLVIMINCDKTESIILEQIDSYPNNIGTEWTYHQEIIQKEYESEAFENVIDIDTVKYTIKVSIDKDTILDDTMFVKQFTTRINGNVKSKEYLYIDQEGLKCYAYSNENILISKKNSKYTYFPLYKKSGKTAKNNELNILNKPHLIIKLPLIYNSKWIYVHQTDRLPWQIEKEVIGDGILNINNNEYCCYKVKLNHLYNDAFKGDIFTDWLSKDGLIKSQIIHDNTTIVAIDGIPVKYIQVTETTTLVELKK